MPRFTRENWILQDPGTGGAHDLLVVTFSAAAALRTFGFYPDPATEAHGFSGAFLAPRWMTEFTGAVWAQLVSSRKSTSAESTVIENAGKVVLRALDNQEFAAALLVALQSGGLAAAAVFVETV